MNTLRSFSRLVRPCQRVRQMSDETGTKRKSEKGFNQINMIGRLGSDAELRGNENYPVCTFRIATNEYFVDKSTGEERKRTDWHKISVTHPFLRDTIAINLRKGDKVFLSGKLRNDSFTDKMGNKVKVSYIAPDALCNLTNKYLTQQHEEEEEEE